MPEFNYAETRFKFRTVFHQSNHAYCVCMCSYEHEYLDKISSQGAIDEEKYNRVLQFRATENRFFAGLDRFLVCKTDSFCIKRLFFQSEKTHFADHILAQLPGLVKCQTVNCP